MEISIETLDRKIDRLIESVSIPKEIFTSEEAAKYLCISYDALMRYARVGFIRSASNGRSKIFRKEWLDEWIENGGTE